MPDHRLPVHDRGPAAPDRGGTTARGLLDARQQLADAQSALPDPWWSIVAAVGVTAVGLVEWPVALGVACVYTAAKLWPLSNTPRPGIGAAGRPSGAGQPL